MKGKIKNGFLYIERKNSEFKRQYCPFDNTSGAALDDGIFLDKSICGDWCPLFGEPETEDPLHPTLYRGIEVLEGERITSLQICKRQLFFDDFEEERNEKNDTDSA